MVQPGVACRTTNHGRLEQASFDKLRMSGYQWIALLCNRPRVQSLPLADIRKITADFGPWIPAFAGMAGPFDAGAIGILLPCNPRLIARNCGYIVV